MDELKRLRDAIDAIDSQLVGLLNDRARLAQEIGRIKERDGRPVYVPERAEHLVARLASQSKGPLGEQAIRSIYTEIMSAALALEKEMVVACEGESGGPAHFAARRQFGSSIRFSFHTDPEQIVEAIRLGQADCGVVSERLFCNDKHLKGNELNVISKTTSDHAPQTNFLVLGRTQHPS
jgi:chorismate mutase / prephenate dehydratase